MKFKTKGHLNDHIKRHINEIESFDKIIESIERDKVEDYDSKKTISDDSSFHLKKNSNFIKENSRTGQ
jgi:hypothetical protein